MSSSLRERAEAWCREGRSFGWRAPLLAYGLFLAFKVTADSHLFTPVDFLDLGIHELGHVVLMPFGQWIGVAGGSLAQVLAPLYGIWQFLRQQDYFAAAFGLGWLGESLHNLSIYIGDARRQELPLANLFGGDPIHDWNYLLGSLHLLAADARIAGAVRALAFFCVIAFLWTGSWLVVRMLRAKVGG
jgi:hypothetical protein